MDQSSKLYDRDFFAWTEQQSGRIRAAASVQPSLLIDWIEVAEEIEDLGKSLERELHSRLATIIEHLLKLQYSPALEPREGWASTVLRERDMVERMLEQSPSLRTRIPRLLQSAQRSAAKLVAFSLGQRGELNPTATRALASLSLTEEHVMGEWLPAYVGAADPALP